MHTHISIGNIHLVLISDHLYVLHNCPSHTSLPNLFSKDILTDVSFQMLDGYITVYVCVADFNIYIFRACIFNILHFLCCTVSCLSWVSFYVVLSLSSDVLLKLKWTPLQKSP